jgi:hypothetical protein
LLRQLRVLAPGLFQRGKGGVGGVELQYAVGLDGVFGLHGVEVLLHLEGQPLPGGEADRVGLELFGGPDLLHGVAQGLLHEIQRGLVDSSSGASVFSSVSFFSVLLQLAVQSGAELLVLVGVHHLGGELVHLLGEVEDLHPVVLEPLDLGQVVDRGDVSRRRRSR